MKNIRLLLIFLSVCAIGINAVDVHAYAAEETNLYMAINPERAIICAIIAVVAGVTAYLWRHRKQV